MVPSSTVLVCNASRPASSVAASVRALRTSTRQPRASASFSSRCVATCRGASRRSAGAAAGLRTGAHLKNERDASTRAHASNPRLLFWGFLGFFETLRTQPTPQWHLDGDSKKS